MDLLSTEELEGLRDHLLWCLSISDSAALAEALPADPRRLRQLVEGEVQVLCVDGDTTIEPFGARLLFESAERGFIDVVATLLSTRLRTDFASADVDRANYLGSFALGISSGCDCSQTLHAALSHCNDAVAVELLKLGADLNAPTRGGRIPLDLALQNNRVAATQLILALGAGLATPDEAGRTWLYRAASRDEGALVRALIEHGHNPGEISPGVRGETALHAAVRFDSAAATVLLEAGAPLHYCSDVGESPFHVAAESWNRPALDLLIAAARKRGHDSSATPVIDIHRNYDGATALHLAAARGASSALHQRMGRECVQALIVAGAGLEVRDAAGRTALHRAAAVRGSPLAALCEAGANLEARDEDGLTPVDHAVRAGQRLNAERLEQYRIDSERA